MKILIYMAFFSGFFVSVQAQFEISSSRTWDKYPPQAQKPGFGLHKSEILQMDDDPALEEVLLFSAHNGHYPYFDLFKNYYVIVDNYTKAIQYMTDITVSTERNIWVEDRNKDGKYELYLKYFKDGEFSVDEKGNNLSVNWMYDVIEWKSKGE